MIPFPYNLGIKAPTANRIFHTRRAVESAIADLVIVILYDDLTHLINNNYEHSLWPWIFTMNLAIFKSSGIFFHILLRFSSGPEKYNFATAI